MLKSCYPSLVLQPSSAYMSSGLLATGMRRGMNTIGLLLTETNWFHLRIGLGFISEIIKNVCCSRLMMAVLTNTSVVTWNLTYVRNRRQSKYLRLRHNCMFPTSVERSVLAGHSKVMSLFTPRLWSLMAHWSECMAFIKRSVWIWDTVFFLYSYYE